LWAFAEREEKALRGYIAIAQSVRTRFLRVVVRDTVADGSFKFLSNSMSDFLFCVEVFLEGDRCLVGRLEERRSSVAGSVQEWRIRDLVLVSFARRRPWLFSTNIDDHRSICGFCFVLFFSLLLQIVSPQKT